jgi:exopolysaccharide biosynthesis polyprenyl glycosylphosphotransferase
MWVKSWSQRKHWIVVGDGIVVLLCLVLATLVRLGHVSNLTRKGLWPILLVLGTYLWAFYIADLYGVDLGSLRPLPSLRIVSTVIGSTLLLGCVFYLVPAFEFGRGIVGLLGLSLAIFLGLWRWAIQKLFGFLSGRRLLIVANGRAAHHVEKVTRVLPAGVSAVGRLAADGEYGPAQLPILGGLADAQRIIREYGITDVVVDDSFFDERLIHSLLLARFSGVRVCALTDFFQSTVGQVPLECLTDHSLLFSEGFGFFGGPVVRRLKRFEDVCLSAVLLLLGAPLMLLVALAIRLTSRGPVFYRQKRVGKNEELFELVKFRSMEVQGGDRQARWAHVNDARVTPLGRWLRRFHLDELPQVYNVLRGDMSFIGPRPEQPEFVEVLKKIPYYSFRHCVSPGITGWAQVNYGYAGSLDSSKEKLQYDLYYVKNLSLALDLHIVLKTIRVLFHHPEHPRPVSWHEKLSGAVPLHPAERGHVKPTAADPETGPLQ